MWRYIGGGAAIFFLLSATVFLTRQMASSEVTLPDPPALSASDQSPLIAPVADEATKEERRFNRYDRYKNGSVGRGEYLSSRQKAFARLDRNGDGRLSFDEYAVKASEKFGAADKNRSGGLDRQEFATTRVVRKPKPKADCKPVSQPAETVDAEA